MRGRVWLRVLLTLIAAGPWLPAQAAQVEGLRVSSGPEATRVVLDLSAPAEHRLFTLTDPDRLVIDFPRTALSAPIRLPEPKGYVAQVRTGKRPSGALRVVLDLKRRVRPNSFELGPNGPYGHRLVIDLTPASAGAAVPQTVAASTARGRDLVVTIDAGHGGRDPGASGPHGVREKDVVLAISRLLEQQLDSVPGIRPVMTRDGDYYVRHRRRMGIAREEQADLFISIHADAFRNASAVGATIYALSTERASDEVARRLAERENASDLIGGVSIADKDKVLARVLLDLSQNAAISASIAVGSHIIEHLSHVTLMRKTRVQHAPFVVLTSPDIPSILVETAYISNPRQESYLRSPAYQSLLAQALCNGIVDYFRTNAPPDSYFALNPPPAPITPVRHVISSGETLSEIAQHYRISLGTLRQVNSLDDDVIRIGQVLTIPPG